MNAYLCFIVTDTRAGINMTITEQAITAEMETQCGMEETQAGKRITIESDVAPCANYAFIWGDYEENGAWYQISKLESDTGGAWMIYLDDVKEDNIPYILLNLGDDL